MNKIELRPTGELMNHKPVFVREARTVLNMKADAFGHKLLCDSATLNSGDACAYHCPYCYVEAANNKMLSGPLKVLGKKHSEIVIRRAHSVEILRQQLTTKHGKPRYADPFDRRVVITSTTVDCAANLRLAIETAKLVTVILELTNWQVRMLSKSNLLPVVVHNIPERYHDRLILGVSTGTLDDSIASAIESGTALVSKRIESLHKLQDMGLRTFGMISPSLPQTNYLKFSSDMASALRADRCEHVWAEVINLRAESFSRTIQCLRTAGFATEALKLESVCGIDSKANWEQYARDTFEAHATVFPATQLRFLQYVTKKTAPWWATKVPAGAVLLGKHAPLLDAPVAKQPTKLSVRSAAAHKAWDTIRTRYSPELISGRQRLAGIKAWKTRRALPTN